MSSYLVKNSRANDIIEDYFLSFDIADRSMYLLFDEANLFDLVNVVAIFLQFNRLQINLTVRKYMLHGKVYSYRYHLHVLHLNSVLRKFVCIYFHFDFGFDAAH